MRLPSSSTYGFWLALLRIYAGAFWLMHGIPKFTQSQDFMPPTGMMMQFVNNAVQHTSGPYQQFLTSVVLPNASLFAELVRLGEVITGCLLLLGFFTRVGGFIGVLLALNYLSAKGGLGHLSMWSGLDAAALALSAINLVLPTGRVLGVDGLLARSRRPAKTAAEQPVFVDEPPMTGPTAPSS
ncbi:MAG: DoxX family membrane protein [Candidatus Eremiobacteraeota bacterium]|nr:DoxX family membrane protein [Candidatus Eremiobacteraeota bacterium]